MRILIVSDSHGNIARLKHVFGFAQAGDIEAVIHCGDWDNTEATEPIENLKIPFYSVLGNADIDPAVQTSLREANVIFDPSFLKLELGGRKIGVCHFPGKLADAIKSQQYDALFHGHTHRRKNEVHGKTLVVNPGPLTGPAPSFAIYDTEANSVEFIKAAV